MADKFTFGSAGEIQEVEFALARNGWTHTLLKTATGGNFFELVRKVLEGRAEICEVKNLTSGRSAIMTVATQNIIDCDVVPLKGFIIAPESKQLRNRVRGQFVLDPAKVRLHLCSNQQRSKTIKGINLFRELANKPVLPANVLDYYLAHPELIPEEYKGKNVYFWGTIYCSSQGNNLCVRYLYCVGGRYRSHYSWLDEEFGDCRPAAVEQ